jgi:hypothetical protein
MIATTAVFIAWLPKRLEIWTGDAGAARRGFIEGGWSKGPWMRYALSADFKACSPIGPLEKFAFLSPGSNALTDQRFPLGPQEPTLLYDGVDAWQTHGGRR